MSYKIIWVFTKLLLSYWRYEMRNEILSNEKKEEATSYFNKSMQTLENHRTLKDSMNIFLFKKVFHYVKN